MPKKVIITEELGEVEEKGFKIFPKEVWDEENIKKYLQRRAKLLRHTPSISEIEKDKDGPRRKGVLNMFGSYEHAILAAGLELPSPPLTQYSDEELLEVARKWSRENPNKKMSSLILRNHPDLPNPGLVCERFGGMVEYCERAGIPHENGISPWAGDNPTTNNRPTNLMYKEMYLRGF